VFLDTLDIRESYALGSLATVFQTEVYAILACSDHCRSANMHNMTICICSDSKTAFLAPLHQCWLSLQDLSNNHRVRLFWVPGRCNIKGNEEGDRLARMGSDSHFCYQFFQSKMASITTVSIYFFFIFLI
jgi:hypothetical protein